MPQAEHTLDLTDHFLIAMPAMQDRLFGKSVVYVCEHTARGAMGVIVNKRSEFEVSDLFAKVQMPLGRAELGDQPVLVGGPLQQERGFVLHDVVGEPQSVADALPMLAPMEEAAKSQREAAYASSIVVGQSGLALTTSRDVLEALSVGAGPRRLLFTVGYASWAPGQLESELVENQWLTVTANSHLMFGVPIEARYDEAMALLGLQPWMLAPGAGHA